MENIFVSDKKVINVKLVHLILLYAIIPIILLMVLVDQLVLNHLILVTSPFRPESWMIWVYVFGMPHVVGGMQMFADKEYLSVYGWKLFRIFAVCLLLPILVVSFFGEKAMFAIFMMFIVYHTVAQQLGLTLVALKRPPDMFFYVWKWSTLGVAAILYTMLYSIPFPIALVNSGLREVLIISVKLLLGIVVLAASMLMWKNRSNRIGMVYVGSNVALIVTECFLFYMHYYFLVVILGRIIHEFTAWPIYVAHDHNRNLMGAKNWIYRAFKGSLSPAILCLMTAFSIGFALMFTLSAIPALASVLVSLSIYHYYTEHFLWRRDSLLRNHVNFIR